MSNINAICLLATVYNMYRIYIAYVVQIVYRLVYHAMLMRFKCFNYIAFSCIVSLNFLNETNFVFVVTLKQSTIFCVTICI